MLSTLVFAPPSLPAERRSGAFVRTLAALVPAIVEGAVRDVTLLRIGADDGVSSVADDAGCRVAGGADLAEAFARGAAEARSPWLLVLVAGAAPTRLFGEEVTRAMEDLGGGQGGLVLRERARGGLGRWIPALAPAAGAVLPRERLAEGRCPGFADVVRRARPSTSLPTPAPVHR